MGRLGEGLMSVTSCPWTLFFAAFPLPPLPKLTTKAVYPPVRPSLYLPLWDVLQYLNVVSTAWALELEAWGEGLVPQSRDCFKGFLLEVWKLILCILSQFRTVEQDLQAPCGIWTWRMSRGGGRSRMLEDPFSQLQWTHLASALWGTAWSMWERLLS